MGKFVVSIFFVLCIISFNACCKGGSGGKADITVSPYHHSKPIPGATVYVKYNATELPGTSPSNFDANYTATANSLPIKCSDLKCGNYYLYVVGYDSSIMQTVKGGIGVKIKYKDRKENTNVNVPVTE